jgi:hypothetical protein
MEKIEFDPFITLEMVPDYMGDGPGFRDIPVASVRGADPTGLGGTWLFYEDSGRESAIRVKETPEEIAKLILRVVHAWRYDALKPKSAKESGSGCQMEAGKQTESEQNVYKEAQKSFAESEIERIDREISARYDAAMKGDYDPTAWARTPAGNILPSPQKPEGRPEAGGDRVKFATGTVSLSKAKLASMFGGPLPPVGKCSFCGGAHLSEDHTAIGYLGRNEPAPDRLEAQALSYELPKDPVGIAPKDPLRNALAKFADSLNSAIPNRPDKQLSLADLEEYIIKTLEDPGSALTLQTGGQAIRQGRPVYLSPELRINFPPDRGH